MFLGYKRTSPEYYVLDLASRKLEPCENFKSVVSMIQKLYKGSQNIFYQPSITGLTSQLSSSQTDEDGFKYLKATPQSMRSSRFQ